jgi:peroxiredoxin
MATIHRRVRCATLALLVSVLARGAVSAKDSSAPVEVGSAIQGLTIKDIRWVERTLKDFGEKKVFVLVFAGVHCPVAAKYLPRLSRLADEYRDRGVQLVGINSSPDDTLVDVAADALEKKLTFPVHKDFDQSAARLVGITRTPEVAVLDAGGALRYRGRIDDQFRAAGESPNEGRAYLREAVDAVLAGKSPDVTSTTPEGCSISPRPVASLPGVNFAEHVAPILQKNCQECHRPDQPAPFSLLTYEDASRRASMIREVVEERRMPPCYSDARHGEFINRRALTGEEIDAISAWSAAGAPRGDASRAPPNPDWPTSRWLIGEPDLVLKIPREVKVPATGYVSYQYAVLAACTDDAAAAPVDYEFPDDTWVQAIQILPGERRALHHANLYIIQPPPLEKIPTFLTGHVPGGEVTRYGRNSGILIPRGGKLRLQLHYVTSGKELVDRTQVGIVFAKEPIHHRTKCLMMINNKFQIPPFDPAYEMHANGTFADDALGVGLYIHMHLRGKDMTFLARYPDGTRETLLSVPNYSFDWQMSYVWAPGAKRFPAGTEIETVSHYDNSPLNPFNPDPAKTVKEGQQTYQEMNYGFFFYTDANEKLDIEVDPKTGRPVRGQGPSRARDGDDSAPRRARV